MQNEENEQKTNNVALESDQEQNNAANINFTDTENSATTDNAKSNVPWWKTHKVFSFVRRSARLDARLQRAWDTYADQYLLPIANPENVSLRDDFVLNQQFLTQQFPTEAPLTIEIGSGQGENVVAAAQAHPERNFIAIEVYDPGVAHTMLLAGKLGLTNLKIAQVNAPELIAACEPGIVDEIWTFFPDPWPKMRHHKRRIVQEELANSVHKALRNGGVWRIATDIEDYALHVHEVMDALNNFKNLGKKSVSLPTEHVGKGNAADADSLPHADFLESERFEGRVLTNFEKKGLDAGRVIYDFTYQTV